MSAHTGKGGGGRAAIGLGIPPHRQDQPELNACPSLLSLAGPWLVAVQPLDPALGPSRLSVPGGLDVGSDIVCMKARYNVMSFYFGILYIKNIYLRNTQVLWRSKSGPSAAPDRPGQRWASQSRSGPASKGWGL